LDIDGVYSILKKHRDPGFENRYRVIYPVKVKSHDFSGEWEGRQNTWFLFIKMASSKYRRRIRKVLFLASLAPQTGSYGTWSTVLSSRDRGIKLFLSSIWFQKTADGLKDRGGVSLDESHGF
jgi:hypothetical protein